MDDIRGSVEAVLDALAERDDASADWRSVLRDRLKAVARALQTSAGPGLGVQSGMGSGGVAQVPWVVVLRSGQSPRHGQYPVLLFASDGSAAYMSLNQGTAFSSPSEIRSSTAKLRHAVGELPERFASEIDLHATSAVPRKYELASITASCYQRGAVPADEMIEEDLRTLIRLTPDLDASESDVSPAAVEAWIFQSKPDQYDLSGALTALDEQPWLVNQYPNQIHVGHRAYLWETGPRAAILATCRVLTEPASMEESGEEREYRLKPEEYAGSRRRVRVAVDQVLDPPITRSRLREDAVLSGLPNLRFAQGTNFPVTREQDDALQSMIGGASELVLEQPTVGLSTAAPLTLDWLQECTLWDRSRLEQLVSALRDDSRQLVLAGPPGTGKTWVAQAISRFLVQDDPARWRVVQFHPSYTYEQFIEGLRPVVKTGGVQFERVDGIVLDVIRKMRSPDDLTILLIDEMNRGNLPRVFGELMYLFEYRDQAIDLQYSKSFALPSGLRFVGTMNTADRSIRSIDVALRRRFDVYDCPPDRKVLERYYESRENQVDDLLNGFDKLNGKLTAALDRHHTIGHTFFMSDPMTPDRLKHVWIHKIEPLIEEYFFDQPDLAAAFGIHDFWPSVS